MQLSKGSRPLRSRLGLGKLRVQVTVAVFVAAAACAYVASTSSNSELASTYRDGAREVLSVAGANFARDFNRADLDQPERLGRQLRQLRDLNANLAGASIYARRPGGLASIATDVPGERAVGRALEPDLQGVIDTGRKVAVEYEDARGHFVVTSFPLRDRGRVVAVLEIAYNLGPSDDTLSDRSTRIALILAALLLTFAAFTALLLSRKIFVPLERLRSATHKIKSGELESRLNWGRRDEIGVLARDFDEMAAELEQNHLLLKRLASTDPLTSLANHRKFHELLDIEMARARRANATLSVVALDLDAFRLINDTHGHLYGDTVLTEVGELLRTVLRPGDHLARIGGDEFAMILPGCDGKEAATLAERARVTLTAVMARGARLGCSSGIASFPQDSGESATLLEMADGALLWAKRSGKGLVRRYDAHHVAPPSTPRQRAIVADMLASADAIVSVFQPIVEIATGRVAGYEALSRFQHPPERAPEAWFALARHCGLGPELEARCVRSAIAVPDRPEGAFLSVNISPATLATPEVQASLPEDMHGLIIEITEHELVVDDFALDTHLAALRARGARVALDDAGSGYSGLGQVMRMRPEIIKLDHSLVAGISESTHNAALVESFTTFASRTGAEVCAEGVETLAELKLLNTLGVNYCQGYALGRPVAGWSDPYPEAIEALSAQRSA